MFEMIDLSTVGVYYSGERVDLNIKGLRKSTMVSMDTHIFDALNGYVATLSGAKQHQLFVLYDDINNLLTSPIGMDFVTQQEVLSDLVAKIYQTLDFDEFISYSRKYPVIYPTNLVNRNDASAEFLNDEINYYMDDYEALVVLTQLLRPMVPIWGAYVTHNREVVGNAYKEFRAFKLLHKVRIYQSPAMERLRRYIDAWRKTSSRKLADNAAVIDGISSDNLTEYLLGLILVRRLALSELDAQNNNSSLVAAVYNYLRTKLTDAERNFSVKHKFNTRNDSDPDELSVIDKYRTPSDLSHGDRRFILEGANEWDTLVRVIDPSTPLALVQECIDALQKNEYHHVIEEHTDLITGWMCQPAFPHEGLVELKKQSLVNVVGVAQAFLIHWGYYDMAVFLTASRSTSKMGSDRVSPNYTVADDVLAALDVAYAHKRQSRGQSVKENQTLEAIYMLHRKVNNSLFHIAPYQPKTLFDKKVYPADITTPADFIPILCSVLVKIDQLVNED